MKNSIFEFDINQVEFDGRYENEEYKTVTLYFIAPKEWLGDEFPEAIHCEISVEYPEEHPDARYATAMMSPTREDEDGNSEDYDWFDLVLLDSEIEALIDLGRRVI